MTYEAARAAARKIAETTGRPTHDVGLVLGSGLSGFVDDLDGAVVMATADLGLPQPKVVGHIGRAVSVELGDTRLLTCAGRVHAYEGWDLEDVVMGVRTMALAGCQTVILTNASGGIGDGLRPGDLVAISDHMNTIGRDPLVGDNDERLGPRFPDMSSVYPQNLRDLLATAAAAVGIEYREGVYAWQLGPSYETPAEIEVLRRLGADMVGMSTVPEAIALAHMGVPVIGISLVTNLAAGIGTEPLSHEEVTETAGMARAKFTALLLDLIPRIPLA